MSQTVMEPQKGWLFPQPFLLPPGNSAVLSSPASLRVRPTHIQLSSGQWNESKSYMETCRCEQLTFSKSFSFPCLDKHGDPAEGDRGLGGMLPGSSSWGVNMKDNMSYLRKYTFQIHLFSC